MLPYRVISNIVIVSQSMYRQLIIQYGKEEVDKWAKPYEPMSLVHGDDEDERLREHVFAR